MSKGLPVVVKDNLEKCRSAAIAAVDVYNRPGQDSEQPITLFSSSSHGRDCFTPFFIENG